MYFIPTLTQKYNDLKAFVKRSFPDEAERNALWNYISAMVLSEDKTKINEEKLKYFDSFVSDDAKLAFVDEYETEEKKVDVFETVEKHGITPPWALIQIGNNPQINPQLVRIFYTKQL